MDFKKIKEFYLNKPQLFDYLEEIGALQNCSDSMQKLHLANVLNDTIIYGAELADKDFNPIESRNDKIMKSLLADLPVIMRKLFLLTNGAITDYYDVWISYEMFYLREYEKNYHRLNGLGSEDTLWALTIEDFINDYITKRALLSEDDEF